ncbi:glycosyltransferase family 2 protein [bacterium]|nr:glycosyltransferase family 2 protein [bacterium]
MPKISIIIPVYNVEKYLRECLDSCINQTLKDIEIICVDDYSTDNSFKILEEYQQNDSRIKIFKQAENKKQGAARNKGLEVATGEYIWFVDSDDYIDTKACQILYDAIKEFNVDMLCFSAIQFTQAKEKRHFAYHTYHHQGIQINKVYHPRTNWKECKFSNFNVSPCMYLTKRSIIQKFRFRENVFYEDSDFTPVLLASVDSFCYIPYTAYFYRINFQSTSHSPVTQKKLDDAIFCMDLLDQFIVKNKIDKRHFFYDSFIKQLNWVINLQNNNKDLPLENFSKLLNLKLKYHKDLKNLNPYKRYSLKRFLGKVWKKFISKNND